ncbi:FecR domain-containing protein [Parabacteroides sp. BX2]|jgi:transmembrane sensor|uniref:FecR domain-containing protein n=1 Tax=Parabacteroides segnis TaxID=2763058 RepID=A0ABR7E8H8_9BACT|nr:MULTISPECIES: FecR domain-containing protein [Parabacteroides]MBC5645439.1 FecR domain-containing protein [Parabacteroides segnis]MCM0715359.1 FecR domain-containing protein [Parabacteroides sp. TA-V-105]
MADLKYINNLLKRFVDGLYTRKDADDLLKHFHAGKYNTEISEAMDTVWEEMEEDEVSSLQHQQYREEARLLLSRIRKPEKRFSFIPYLRYVAIVAVILSIGWGGFRLIRSNQEKVLTYTEVHVKNGEHKRVILPDGTSVTLNAGSYLRYPREFITDVRRIEMNGEAFFEVTRDEEKPFLIHTKDADVKVLGTSFNVKAFDMDEQLTVSVQTGKVQVDLPEAMMRLLPDEQFVMDKTKGEFQKRNEDARLSTVWIKGGLYFNRTPIRTVVNELVRMYNRTIEFAPGAEYDDYIYGEHDNKSLEAVLKSIQYSTDIKYRIENDKIVLYKN